MQHLPRACLLSFFSCVCVAGGGGGVSVYGNVFKEKSDFVDIFSIFISWDV